MVALGILFAQGSEANSTLPSVAATSDDTSQVASTTDFVAREDDVEGYNLTAVTGYGQSLDEKLIFTFEHNYIFIQTLKPTLFIVILFLYFETTRAYSSIFIIIIYENALVHTP